MVINVDGLLIASVSLGIDLHYWRVIQNRSRFVFLLVIVVVPLLRHVTRLLSELDNTSFREKWKTCRFIIALFELCLVVTMSIKCSKGALEHTDCLRLLHDYLSYVQAETWCCSFCNCCQHRITALKKVVEVDDLQLQVESRNHHKIAIMMQSMQSLGLPRGLTLQRMTLPLRTPLGQEVFPMPIPFLYQSPLSSLSFPPVPISQAPQALEAPQTPPQSFLTPPEQPSTPVSSADETPADLSSSSETVRTPSANPTVTEAVLSLTDDVYAIAKKLYDIAEAEHSAQEHLDKRSVKAISECLPEEHHDASSITSVPSLNQLQKLQHAKKLVKDSKHRLDISRAQAAVAQKRLEIAQAQARLAEDRLDWARRRLDLAQAEMDESLSKGSW